jgi:hypothetical protein
MVGQGLWVFGLEHSGIDVFAVHAPSFVSHQFVCFGTVYIDSYVRHLGSQSMIYMSTVYNETNQRKKSCFTG